MLLTITTTHKPATDLGYLLHKHPDRVNEVSLSFGRATVVYPVAEPDRCTAALIVEVDPVELVRGRREAARDAVTLGQYVNDRPYAASSFLSTAIAKTFGTAMTGRSKERPELSAMPLPLELTIAALPCRGGDAILRRLFEPLGYVVEATQLPLDPSLEAWGPSRYFDVVLRCTLPVRAALEHLHVLIPVLDDAKHYWVGDEEIERLLRRGGEWLASHPERELITSRALRHDRRLTNQALARLASIDLGGAEADPEAADERADEEEAVVEERISLNDQRLNTVVRTLATMRSRRVLDLGCGEGRLLSRILSDLSAVDHVVGVDVSMRALHRASKRLHLDTMSPSKRKRVSLIQGALTYRDKRLLGADTVTLIEVIEHVDEERLPALERVVFHHIGPAAVIVTTPNIEYNTLFAQAGLRHRDHRFEWTREEFGTWASRVCDRYGYEVRHEPIGPLDAKLGAPTQMAVFTKTPKAGAP